MPFLERGTGADFAGPAADMTVDPDKILQLKKRLEDRRDIVRRYAWGKGDTLFNVRPPGGDLCSALNAQCVTKNGADALTATQGFTDALSSAIDRLHETAVAYGLVEDANADRFRQGPR